MRKVYVIITGIFLTLLFTACKQFTADMEDYLSYWAAEVSPMDNSIDKPHPKNAEGVRCVSSGNPVTVTIKLRNPKNLTLWTPTVSSDAGKVINFPGQSTQPTYGTDYTLQQTANDKLELTYKPAFLQRCEWSESSIGADITLISTDGRQFNTTASIKLEANTPPPKPTAVLAQTNSASPTYVLCLQVPDMGVSVTGGLLHKDIAQIEINGTSYPLTVSGGDFVKPSDAHFITAVTQLVGYPAPPAGAWVLYYDTGLSVGNAYQAYTVKLKDNKGLVSAVLETGTARPQPPAETVTIARGQQGAGSGSGTSAGSPIIINGETSAPEAQITIQNIAGTTVHCTVQEVVGGSATGAVSPYDGNPVNVPLGLGTANEKIYEVKYHTDGEGYTQTSTTTKYYKVLKCHSVTFDANGGTFTDGSTTSASRTVLVPHNTAAAAPSGTDVPARAGYTLGSSWYTEAGCTTQWNFTTPITSNITLYAKWTANSGTSYRVEYYKEDLTENQYTSAPQIDTPTGTTGAATVATPKNYPGFEFDRQDPVSATIAGDNSTVVKVYYKRKSINVTFNLNGGTISGSMSNVIRTGRFGTTLTPPNPVKTGYTFSSWGPNVGSPPLSMPPKFPANDAAYTAQWTAKTDTPYRVEHYKEDLTENQYTSAPQIENPTGTTGTNISVTQKTYTGFQYASQDPASATIGADGNTVVKVYYKRKTVNVTFNPDGGTISGGASNLTVSGRFGTALTAPADPVKTGYTFSSWSPAAGSPALSMSPKFPANDAAYTAQWTANTYTVRFNGNGNTGGTAMSDRTFTYDAAGNLPLNTFTKTGYTFGGWARSSDITTVVRTDGAAANNLAESGTVDLYAVWYKNPRVTFKVEGGTGGSLKGTYGSSTEIAGGTTEKSFTVTYGGSINFETTPTYAWEVEHWTGLTASPANAATVTFSDITQDTTVKVKFKKTTTVKSTDPQPWKLLKEVIKIADNNAVITINGEIEATSGDNAGELKTYLPSSGRLTIQGGTTDAALNAKSQNRIFKIDNDNTLNLKNLTLKNGKASGSGENANGGALYIGPNVPTINLTQVTLTDNTASGNGGAIYIDNARVNLTKVTLTNNTANGDGGAIYNTRCELKIKGSTIENNTAANYGGSIYTKHATITIIDNEGTQKTAIKLNKAKYGAGLCYINCANNEIKGNTEITENGNNTVTEEGGAIYMSSTVASAVRVSILGNTKITNCKAKKGGAVYMSGDISFFIRGNTEIKNCTANAGGGAYVHSIGTSGWGFNIERAAKFTVSTGGDANKIGKNDVYLNSGCMISASSLTTGNGQAARISIDSGAYSTGTKVLDGGAANNHKKFIVTPQTGSGSNWYVDSDGKLTQTEPW